MTEPIRWTSACGNSACVEVGAAGDTVLIRDSKTPDQQPLTFTWAEWHQFADGIKRGAFDDLPEEQP